MSISVLTWISHIIAIQPIVYLAGLHNILVLAIWFLFDMQNIVLRPGTQGSLCCRTGKKSLQQFNSISFPNHFKQLVVKIFTEIYINYVLSSNPFCKWWIISCIVLTKVREECSWAAAGTENGSKKSELPLSLIALSGAGIMGMRD